MSNAALVNFAGGETSPKSRGRFDIASYNSSCRKLVNFIAEVSGPARFRPGFRKAAETYGSAVARMIPFQFNDSQAYMLEFTHLKMRVYRDGALVMDGAAPYEIASPYAASDLDKIFYSQTLNTLYIDCLGYSPRKLVATAGGSIFIIAEYTRTNDPFAPEATTPSTFGFGSVTRQSLMGNIALIGVTSGSVITGVDYTLSCAELTGVTPAIHGGIFKLKDASGLFSPPWPGHYQLFDPTTGDPIIFTAWAPPGGTNTFAVTGTATSGGGGTTEHALAVAFYENRTVHAGTAVRPRTLFLSRSPLASTGASRLEDFTGGTDPDHACFFSLAPVNGTVDYIAWAGGTSKYLLIGTFGGVFRVSGGGTDEPITPSSINVKQIDSYGCAPIAPALNGPQAYFIQRGGGTLRGVKYSLESDELSSEDMCLNADQIGWSPLTRVVLQTAKPDVLWAIREDGVLCGMTVQNGERVAGWHRHRIGGKDAKVIDVAVLPRPGAPDQLYIVAERTVNGATVRTVEVMTDDVTFPDPEDFFTGEGNKAADEARYKAAVYRRQEQYSHLDAEAVYDGSDRGTAAAAALTPAAVTGTTIGFTASAGVFVAGDVGKELWKKPDMLTGLGAGKAVITEYVSATHVHVDITEDFNSTAAIAAGEWHFAVKTISGLSHLEGEKVAVVADGAVIADGQDPSDYAVITVTGGAITLDEPAAVVHVGLPYEGMLITHNLEVGGQTGPAQDKARNLSRLGIRFLNSLGCEYGTSLYKTERVEFHSSADAAGRPSPVFSGIKVVHVSDTWLTENGDKNVVIVQKLPLPCVVQFIDVQYTTGDEI